MVLASSPAVFSLVGNSVVKNALYFLLKVVVIVGFLGLLNYRLGTFVALVPFIALYALKISLFLVLLSYCS